MKFGLIFGAAALAMSAAPAFAQTITFTGGSGAIAPGTAVFQNFNGLTAGSSIGTNAFAYNADTVGTAARPAYGSAGNYAAVLAGGSYSVDFGPTQIFSFVLGSLDTYNTLTLRFQGGGSTSYAGGEIINNMMFPTGNQASTQTNGTVSYNAGSGPLITGATFASSQNAFEFDNLAAGGVPEPATWAMLILGFGLVGVSMRRRSTSVRFAKV